MRPAPTVLAGGLLLLALAGCASSPGDGPGPGSTTALQAVEREICAIVADGTVTPAELQRLGTVLDRAHSLGLPSDVLNPAHEIVTAGEATAPSIRKLRTACR